MATFISPGRGLTFNGMASALKAYNSSDDSFGVPVATSASKLPHPQTCIYRTDDEIASDCVSTTHGCTPSKHWTVTLPYLINCIEGRV